MSSEDYLQVSTILSRLKTLSEFVVPGTIIPNPVRIAELIRDVVSEVSDPPPGDPDTLETLARSFRTAADAIAPIGADVGQLGTTTLPAAWEGGAATEASAVLEATDKAIEGTPAAFRRAAEAVEDLSDDVRDQQDRHAQLHEDLDAAFYDATHIRVEISTPDWLPGPDITVGGDLPIVDPTALAELCGRVYDLISGCIDVYTDALDTVNRTVTRFADLTGDARAAAAVDGGLAPDDAVVLADKMVDTGLGDGFDDGILTPAQLERAAAKLDALSEGDRAKLQELLDAAGSDEQRAWILKGLAAGHGVAELRPFAEKIREMSPEELSQHLSLIDRGGGGDQERRGIDVRQYEDTTCGTTSLIVARAEADPLYALSLTEGDFEESFKAERDRVHEWTNTHRLPGDVPHWPEGLGTLPPDMAAYMNQYSEATGVEYDYRLVDDTNQRDVSADLRDSLTAANRGDPVPMLVANQNPADGMHYVLITGHENGNVLIYEPTSGDTVSVPESDFLNGTLSDSAGYDHVQSVMVPK
ncbi:MAG: hypothetical protein ACRDQB_09895 [Thermocrispum sp.]